MMRGSLVIARCYGGRLVVLKVWEEHENIVLLSDSCQFDKLEAGLEALLPVGFLKADVFEYDQKIVQDSGSSGVDWNSLTPYNALSRQE